VWFDTPKVVSVSKKLICPICQEDDIILDFFSGSATTAHAVMQLNAEDGGNRKFIMVQLPEPCDEKSEAFKAGYKTIAEIGKERIRRAGARIMNEKAKEQPTMFDDEPNSSFTIHNSQLDIGFRVYKTDSTNMKDVFYHPNELKQYLLPGMESNIKEDRTPEDLLTQVILDLGLELTLPIETKKILGNTVFIVQTNALVACFDKDIDFKIVDFISDLKPLKVVFKDASFKDDKDRINVGERFKRLSPETKVTVI
jgi:adenine-specific DNA-methyltransferase